MIRNETDITEVINHLIKEYTDFAGLPYVKPFNLESLTVSIAKVNSLTGSSYIELPKWISNKKACINIKNEDHLCFLYSVLCGIETPKIHPERVNHYKNRLKELKYKETDMPMWARAKRKGIKYGATRSAGDYRKYKVPVTNSGNLCVCVFITGEGESQNKEKQIWSYEERR